jgi:hypothetical protein
MDGREWIARSTPFLIHAGSSRARARARDRNRLVLAQIEQEHEHEHENDMKQNYTGFPAGSEDANAAALSTLAYISR